MFGADPLRLTAETSVSVPSDRLFSVIDSTEPYSVTAGLLYAFEGIVPIFISIHINLIHFHGPISRATSRDLRVGRVRVPVYSSHVASDSAFQSTR